jgi:hypothetical protein
MLLSTCARAITSAALFSVFFVTMSERPAAQEPPPTPPALPAEIELNVINGPTTQHLGRHKSYFRLTHRFVRDLRQGSFGQLFEDLFGLDNGAVIGLEYRFGITDNLHVGVHRTLLSQTIQFFGKDDLWQQGDSMPVSISVLGSIEGLDNFGQNYQPGIAGIVSRVVKPWFVLYASPTFVWNTQAAEFIEGDHDHDLPGAEEDEHARHEHTMFVGLGTRVRFRPTAYFVGEYSPRLAGHDPGRAVWAAAIEKATRGHTFQILFTNAQGTTLGQIARGGSGSDVYFGFNVTRRF